jgi:hypothetical protein
VQVTHEELLLFDGLIEFPEQLIQTALLNRVLAGQAIQTEPLLGEQIEQRDKQTEQFEKEFP